MLGNLRYLLYSGLGILVIVTGITFARKSQLETEIIPTQSIELKLEAVAALGQLSPSGEVRMLAAPTSSFGGTPRIKDVLIKEGEEIKKGDILAVFDNQPKIIADLQISKARLDKINKQIISKRIEVNRYKKSFLKGASPQITFNQKRDQLIDLLGSQKEVLAEIKGLEVDLSDCYLESPINGIVLKINYREGERPGKEGVIEVGSTQIMEALIEVYESDINRVSIGQKVDLISENGGFDGTLKGQVVQISPKISQRNVLSTDPTGDADARIVEVKVKLEASSSVLVQRLTGMKVIARFQEQ